MPCPFSPINPRVRLNVFISSAQREENGFQWGEVRRQIKDSLEKCPYIIPFAIDVVASEIPSSQLFQYEVLKADVVIMLIKGMVRPGTSIEFTTATKNKKPLLVYFLKDDNPSLEVVQLRKAVEKADYCTYRNIDVFDNIAEVVRDDVFSNIIEWYQVNHYLNGETDTSEVTLSTITGEPRESKYGTPTKTSISWFSSSYSHIFGLLGLYSTHDSIDTESPLHAFGIAALDWLVNGKPLNCDTEILNLISELGTIYESTAWLRKRWDAICLELEGNSEKALEAEKEALKLAKENNLPQWIINDILIDCRNIENEFHHQNQEWVVHSEIQQELNDLDTIVYLPVSDRYLSDIYKAIEKEEFKHQAASYSTVFLGTNFGKVINDVENYFFSAIMYGSYTHMAITREVLAEVLYKYDKITQSQPLLLDCIKLLVVSGNAEQFKKIVDYKWDNIYAEIVSHADEIWKLTDRSHPQNKEFIKRAVLTKLGLYLSDSEFEKGQAFLEDNASTIYWGNSEDYFECINQNMCRLNCQKVIKMLTGIIKEQRFHLGRKLSSIILQIKLDNVDIETQEEFRDALVEKIPFIVQNNGIPQIIAVLAGQNPEMFSVLADIPENGLTGLQKTFYDINMGHGDWKEVLIHEIETARTQFEANKNAGEYTGFYELPYATIKQVMRNHYSSSMNETIEHDFFSLCVDVLNSQAVAKVKNDCLDCLCDVLIFGVDLKEKIPENLSKTISAIEAEKTKTLFGEPAGDFACRTLMIKIISGFANKEKLLEWCVGYSKKTTSERIALAECIEQFMIQGLPTGQIDATILSIVMQCVDDEHYIVRRDACNCLALLLDTKYKDLAERKLCEAAIDASHYVRNQVLILCKNDKIKDLDIRQELFGILANDANYAIRVGCKTLEKR